MTVSSAANGANTPPTSPNPVRSVRTSGANSSSSIDFDLLIQAAVDAKMAKAAAASSKITGNQAKIAAYQNLQNHLGKLSSDLALLSTSVVNPLATNVFAARAATIGATGNVNAASVLSMSVRTGAATGDHTLRIDQIATAQKVAGEAQSSSTTALGLSGGFSIGLAEGDSATITVTSGMTLQDVANAINAQSSTSNVTASIVQVSAGSFQLILTGTKEAVEIVTSSSSGDDILGQLGVIDSAGAFSHELQAAQDARFTLDGIALTRKTNDITDVLDGVTFDLIQPTPAGTSLNISIGADTDRIADALQAFVTDYNAFRDDVLAQQAIAPDGTASSGAVLFGDGAVREIMSRIEKVLGTSVNGLTMGNIGLSLDGRNKLELNTAKLSEALTTNLGGVTALLSAQTRTASSDLKVENTGSSPVSFTLDVTVDNDGKLAGASVGGDSSLFTISGNSIVGKSGTIYAGMAFTYTGSTSKSIEVTSTSGLATQVARLAKDASANSGTFQSLVDGLQSQDGKLQKQVNDITSAAVAFRAQLEARYAKIQAAIQAADNTIHLLTVILNAKSVNQ
jgi:flagellar hook-associated protein 2